MLQDYMASNADIVPFRFTLVPVHKPDELHANIRSATARDLPKVSLCSPHDLELSIVGGGPSLEDTYKNLTGYVVAVNGSLAFLLDHGIVPQMCGVCDPSPHMADIIAADPRVTYFVATCVHPSVFDKLLDAGCLVYRWHCSSIPGGEELLDEIEPDYLMIGGGSTMGLRWITLGYNIGFRKFHLHGFDSSFRGKSSHAYPDHQDAKDWIHFEGFSTRPNFIGQVVDFIGWMERLKDDDVDPVSIKVYGDGLLQEKFKQWKARNPGWHEGGPKPYRPLITDGFVWPKTDREGRFGALTDVRQMGAFLEHVKSREVVVQAGGNVGVYPAYLAKQFQYVHTFEPDPENYACLIKNIATCEGNIRTYNAALGAEEGVCGVSLEVADNCGTVRINGDGNIPMRTIDAMELPACDLIWLDIEGYELQALKGAEKTVEKFWPAIIIEDARHHNYPVPLTEKHGIAPGAATEWLYDHGYIFAFLRGGDRMFLSSALPGLPTRESEKAKYEKAWADYPEYRVRSPGEQLLDLAIELTGMSSPESVIDFGCGPGRATKRMIDLGYKAMGLDIASNCLDPGIDIPFQEACLWELPDSLSADWGYCCDVMEHIPPDRVDEVLAGIRRVTKKGVVFQIAFGEENFGREMGEQLHLTVKNPEWWLMMLKKHWDDLRMVWPLESEIGIRGAIIAT